MMWDEEKIIDGIEWVRKDDALRIISAYRYLAFLFLIGCILFTIFG
jgi:hypothetical protein